MINFTMSYIKVNKFNCLKSMYQSTEVEFLPFTMRTVSINVFAIAIDYGVNR